MIRRGVFIAVFFCLIFSFVVSGVQPNGAMVTVVKSTSNGPSGAGNSSASAGNLTELVIYAGNAGSQSWQGYYGNVSGTLMLADSDDNVFFNWSAVSAAGEVYASTNLTILWTAIQCFNFTAEGNLSNGESGETPGSTNLHGLNLTQLESMYNIASTDLDGVNRTFSSFNHDRFFTSNLEFSADECRSVHIFTNESKAEDGFFEEALLYEPSTGSVVFTSLLEDNVPGFDNVERDFEMLVLEDGHGTDTASTTYFFFLEIE